MLQDNRFTEAQLKEAARNSKSIAGMCRQLGIIPANNYVFIKRWLINYSIDVSHFTGQGWNKDNYKDDPNGTQTIKRKLIRERGHQCEKCKNTTWFEIPITLELEHIDGNNGNNNEVNLILLCPNCHAQTKTWRRKKSSLGKERNIICPSCDGPKKHESKVCLSCYRKAKPDKNRNSESVQKRQRTENLCACGEIISHTAKQCTKCAHIKQQRTNWPSSPDLVVRLRDKKESYLSVAKSLGVSDNSVRKYLRKHGIDPKTFLPLDTEA